MCGRIGLDQESIRVNRSKLLQIVKESWLISSSKDRDSQDISFLSLTSIAYKHHEKKEEFEKSSNHDSITAASENLPPLSEEITVRKRTRPAPVLSGRRSNEATAGPPVALSPLRGTSASRSPHSGEASLEFRPRSRKIILGVRIPASPNQERRKDLRKAQGSPPTKANHTATTSGLIRASTSPCNILVHFAPYFTRATISTGPMSVQRSGSGNH
ncbi:hypothetical protein EAG_05348 [Camponotus floridanus]|uniref:Uncharacterized protein n=1 Tax=Camponotus floridanus TaxID=104421 RepID=E2AXT5_CAMFO|nr:hypothetical protein EAG_05348 [Camponotus floridanus]